LAGGRETIVDIIVVVVVGGFVLPFHVEVLEMSWCYFNLCFYLFQWTVSQLMVMWFCVRVFILTNLFSMHLFNCVFIFILYLLSALPRFSAFQSSTFKVKMYF